MTKYGIVEERMFRYNIGSLYSSIVGYNILRFKAQQWEWEKIGYVCVENPWDNNFNYKTSLGIVAKTLVAAGFTIEDTIETDSLRVLGPGKDVCPRPEHRQINLETEIREIIAGGVK